MKRKRIVTLVFILGLLLFQAPAFAASGSVSISSSPDNIAVGDVFDVAISFSSSGEAISSLQAKLEYDDSSMQYMSGGGNAVEISSGTGGINAMGNSDVYNFTYVLRFTALKSGKATFSVTDAEIIGYTSGADIGGGGKSISINISGASAEPSETPAPAASADPDASLPADASALPSPTETPNDEPIPVDLNGRTAYILRDFGGMILPSGFVESTVTYEGAQIVAASNEQLGIDLVCLMDAGGSTDLYIFADGGKVLFPYVRIVDGNTYVLGEAEAGPEGFQETTVTYQGLTVTAWDGGDGSLPIVYAYNGNGDGAFYYFDSENGTLLRANLDAPVATPEPSPSASATSEPSASAEPVAAAYSPWSDGSILPVVYALAALAVILLIAVIVVRKKKNKDR